MNKKSLGQHWLHDIDTLQRIVDTAHIKDGTDILEVGPGLGTLTQQLLAKGANVTAVEFDEELASALPQRMDYHPSLRVVHQDILSFDLTTLPHPYTVVANIPYYLTSKLVRMLCESANPPQCTVLLVQKEVAQRIAATPGEMSLLSVSAQVYNAVTVGVEVPAYLFTPPPKVDSQVVILQRRPIPLVAPHEQKNFFWCVKAGFSERRKKLRSSLSGGLRLPKETIDSLLERAFIHPNARAQELSIEEWKRLAYHIQNIG